MSRTLSFSVLFSVFFGAALGLVAGGCDSGGDPRGEACGPSICGATQVCCNALEGICTAPGDVCSQ